MADMKHYVNLKDDIAFAYHQSSNIVDTEDDNIIEVDENGSQLLGKKYIDGNFIEAPKIKYAILDSNNVVIGIKETVYSSEVCGPVINDNTVQILATWDGTSFINPTPVVPVEPVIVIPEPISDPEPTV